MTANRGKIMMTAMTGNEVREFLVKNEWSYGIKVRDRQPYQEKHLYYNNPEARTLLLKFPDTPRRATYFARVASFLGAEDESLFYGALLWITLYDIGSPQLEKSGWSMIDMMRRSFGENRPLEAAPGHWFRNGAAVELAAFILPCFVFGWDAWIISNSSFFIHISHDEYWVIVTRDDETYKKMSSELADLKTEEDHQGSLRSFCPNSKYLISPESAR